MRHIRSLALLAAAASACGNSDSNPAATATGSAAAPSAKATGSAAAPSAEPKRPSVIRVTGIPDENPTELVRAYKPLTDLLSKRLGVRVEYVPVTDYGAAVQALAAKKVDFAWLGGFTHVQARNMTDVVPVVMRDIDREFHSVFIANANSGIQSIADLRGKKFAFGSKSSTSGHLMPRHFLVTKHGIDPDKDFDGPPVFSGAHDATVKMVESGKVDAGALNEQVWQRMVKEGSVDTHKVKVIWTTPPYVDYVWTARADVPEDIRRAFADTFLSLDPKNPEHAPVLERMGATKYVPASPSDFDAIEQVAKSIGLLKK
ncbi:MAG: putative selenate ABC transporter substrate-binding protein [Deltaproteobacteria bacterium]|nr:MAG: putative selenate ABC transporter substrate-binding protein [Deltaproteobacteria bacterium]